MSRPADMPGPEAFAHGTRARYVTGCRCEPCRGANRAAYHERQRRAKELAMKISAPATPVAQEWTAPDGSRKVRYFSRACPGVKGAPCRTNSHLRKDSKGGVCGGCRERLVWNGLVDAAPVRRHLRRLSRKGVGYKSVSAASDVSHAILAEVLSGQKRRLRADTAKRILSVTTEAIADHALVPAAKTWTLLEELQAKGFTKAELARRLGLQTEALQFGKAKVLARTALAVERLHRSLVTGGERQRPACRCRAPMKVVWRGTTWCERCDCPIRTKAVKRVA